MKNENGITLIALVITIIVMLILAGITLNTGIYTVSTSQDNIKLSALEIISHAITEQYIKGIEFNSINVEYNATNTQPDLLIGELIADESELDRLSSELEEIQENVSENNKKIKFFYIDTLKEKKNNNTKTYFYEYYYKLNNMALKKLNVDVGTVRDSKESADDIVIDDEESNTGDEYIVNYMTGEVFNCTTKVTSEGKPLYFGGKKMNIIKESSKEKDNEEYKNIFTD